jgi:tRNA(Ile)-lysidine synthase
VSQELLGVLLARCSFPAAGEHVTAAVSGGADSMALLALAVEAGCVVTAVHVDHGLRPESGTEAQVVAAAAGRLGAGFRAVRVDVEQGPDLEARARLARYGVLPPGVLTGHTADDQAETVLLNLIRGAGLPGLAGMVAGASPRPGSRWVRRPLLGLRRAETVALCHALHLDPVADPSNDDPRFLRNRVRREVLPLLAEVGQRDPVPILCRQAGVMADDAALLDQLAGEIDPTDARALAAAPVPLARRAVRAWLRAESDAEAHPPSAGEVARVLAVARGEAVACEVAGGRRVARRGGRLRLGTATP